MSAAPGVVHDGDGARVRKLRPGEFEVVGLGNIVSPMFATRQQARDWLTVRLDTADPRRVPKYRPCLCCGKTMWSTGAHHRLCDNCRR